MPVPQIQSRGAHLDVSPEFSGETSAPFISYCVVKRYANSQDVEDKVKRLQDSQQQSPEPKQPDMSQKPQKTLRLLRGMLKIAGLRSAHKHAEGQARSLSHQRSSLQQNRVLSELSG